MDTFLSNRDNLILNTFLAHQLDARTVEYIRSVLLLKFSTSDGEDIQYLEIYYFRRPCILSSSKVDLSEFILY